MSTLFDTHAAVQKLKSAGFTEQQAEAQVQVLSEIAAGNLATRLDITELKRDIEALRLATRADIAELKTELKTDIAVLKAELGLIKWLLGSIGVGVALLLLRVFWPVITA
jgi:hypothetical protein